MRDLGNDSPVHDVSTPTRLTHLRISLALRVAVTVTAVSGGQGLVTVREVAVVVRRVAVAVYPAPLSPGGPPPLIIIAMIRVVPSRTDPHRVRKDVRIRRAITTSIVTVKPRRGTSQLQQVVSSHIGPGLVAIPAPVAVTVSHVSNPVMFLHRPTICALLLLATSSSSDPPPSSTIIARTGTVAGTGTGTDAAVGTAGAGQLEATRTGAGKRTTREVVINDGGTRGHSTAKAHHVVAITGTDHGIADTSTRAGMGTRAGADLANTDVTLTRAVGGTDVFTGTDSTTAAHSSHGQAGTLSITVDMATAANTDSTGPTTARHQRAAVGLTDTTTGMDGTTATHRISKQGGTSSTTAATATPPSTSRSSTSKMAGSAHCARLRAPAAVLLLLRSTGRSSPRCSDRACAGVLILARAAELMVMEFLGPGGGADHVAVRQRDGPGVGCASRPQVCTTRSRGASHRTEGGQAGTDDSK